MAVTSKKSSESWLNPLNANIQLTIRQFAANLREDKASQNQYPNRNGQFALKSGQSKPLTNKSEQKTKYRIGYDAACIIKKGTEPSV